MFDRLQWLSVLCLIGLWAASCGVATPILGTTTGAANADQISQTVDVVATQTDSQGGDATVPEGSHDVPTDSSGAKMCGRHVECSPTGCTSEPSAFDVFGPVYTACTEVVPHLSHSLVLCAHRGMDGQEGWQSLVRLEPPAGLPTTVTTIANFKNAYEVVDTTGFLVAGYECQGKSKDFISWKGHEIGVPCKWSNYRLSFDGKLKQIESIYGPKPHGILTANLANGDILLLHIFVFDNLATVYWIPAVDGPNRKATIATGPPETYIWSDFIAATTEGFVLAVDASATAKVPAGEQVVLRRFDGVGNLLGSEFVDQGVEVEQWASYSGLGGSIFTTVSDSWYPIRTTAMKRKYWFHHVNSTGKLTSTKKLTGAPAGMGPYSLTPSADGGFWAVLMYAQGAASPVHLARLSPTLDIVWTKLVLPGTSSPMGDLLDISEVPPVLVDAGVTFRPAGGASYLFLLGGSRLAVMTPVLAKSSIVGWLSLRKIMLQSFDTKGNLLCGVPP